MNIYYSYPPICFQLHSIYSPPLQIGNKCKSNSIINLLRLCSYHYQLIERMGDEHMTKKVLIFADPGIDDTIALLHTSIKDE